MIGSLAIEVPLDVALYAYAFGKVIAGAGGSFNLHTISPDTGPGTGVTHRAALRRVALVGVHRCR